MGVSMRTNRFQFLFSITLFFLFLIPGTIISQTEKSPAIYVILDGSGSMWQKLADGSFKIATAKKVLKNFVQRDFSGQELAFRVYGHRRKGDCRDSELVIPFSAADQAIAPLQKFLKTVNPTGKTPISYSLREALKDFQGRAGEIILISDGVETCDDDPCALLREWQKMNIRIKVHVVGFGLDEKSKDALRCIADAAGTPYRDAGSANELAESLSTIHEESASVALKIIATNTSGERLKVRGTLSQNGEEKYPVMSFARNVVEPGEYSMTIGVKTANGNLYQPITQTVLVKESGETTVQLTVPEPPSVATTFLDNEKKVPGGIVSAFQGGEKVFHFRWKDRVYLDEGEYTFYAEPNAENQLSRTEGFAAGEHKELIFELRHTVRVKFRLLAENNGELFRAHQELWQNGELKYKLHHANGGTVLPGDYELKMISNINAFSTPVTVSGEERQEMEISVPAGQITIVYEKADGSQEKDKRFFIGSGTEKRCCTKQSGREITLTPGTYNIEGWRGNYDPVVFQLKAGEEKTIVLKDKP